MTAHSAAGHLDRADVEAALAVAVRAPSIHNTQPWEWRFGPEELVLRADRRRQLGVADPDGHSLMVSCGAALHLTEIALRAQGWRVETTLLPHPADADALAAFRVVGRGQADVEAAADAEAALRRRSDRRPFASHPLEPKLVDELQEATSDEAAWLHVPTAGEQQVDLAVAVSWADRIERDDKEYKAEMQRWLHDPDLHALVDGVPLEAIPHVPEGASRHTDVPLRDFEVGVAGKLLIERDVDEKPLIGVILTAADATLDQLQAGRAMMRLMLAAERRGLSSCPLSQAVDFAAFRTRVQGLMGWVGYPQMMLRIGYPIEPAERTARTPRREPDAVLTLAQSD